MDAILSARALGEEIQKDERFVAYAKAKLVIEDDKELNDMIGQFNIDRLNLERMLESQERDDIAIAEANKKLREGYNTIMETENMKAYTTAKTELDNMMNEIYGILRMCSEGADPKTCTLPESGCTGSCATCGGCH